MTLTRRNVLTLCGISMIGPLTGCLSSDNSRDIPLIEERRIRLLDQVCDDAPTDQCEADFENEGALVSLTGFVSVDNIARRNDLFLYAQNAVGDSDRPSDEVDVDIDPYAPAPEENSEITDCKGYLEYEATIRLSRAPSRVVIRHRKPESRGDPIATFSP